MDKTATVIPSAGLGTRMLPLSAVTPKELLPMGDRSLLQWALLEADKAGVTQAIVVGGPQKSFADFRTASDRHKHSLQKNAGNAAEFVALNEKIEIQEVQQDKPLGLGHAVLQAEPNIASESFFVQLPDEWFPDADCFPTLQKALLEARKQHPEIQAAIAVMEVSEQETSSYGIACPGEIVTQAGAFVCHSFVEKPSPEDAPSRWAIVGRYLLPTSIFSVLAATGTGAGGEIQLTDALATLAARGEVIAVPFSGVRIDTGNLDAYFGAWQYWLTNLKK